ncbi:MAG: hypothetical protein MZW92_40905 [Comamonadaceae bacterium]|nr:hypothetical protein [Comamonadaceae bacterium]
MSQFTRPPHARADAGGEYAGRAPPVPSVDELPQLKLYQPVHNRYYLVTASLVCRRPGLPDRRVNPGRQEQARFVLRRLLPAAGATGRPPPIHACGASTASYRSKTPPNGEPWVRTPTAS